jgi:hypothetical protein
MPPVNPITTVTVDQAEGDVTYEGPTITPMTKDIEDKGIFPQHEEEDPLDKAQAVRHGMFI